MIVTEFYRGQGLGNQLFCYVATRAIAQKNGYKFGIQNPQNFKGAELFDLDFGQSVRGGQGPEGGPPTRLPDQIKFYYAERKITHPESGADIRIFDLFLDRIPDKTKIDGIMQDELYFGEFKSEVRQWLSVKFPIQHPELIQPNVCLLNFRGGEYKYHPDLYLPATYWRQAMRFMAAQNSNLQFVIITDDVAAARKMLPEIPAFHFSIAEDYALLCQAKYLILSNSSFGWFPAWLNQDLKLCIAPKYWARFNSSDGYWSCGSNLTADWHYLDRSGRFQTAAECQLEWRKYQQAHHNFLIEKQSDLKMVISNYSNDLSWVPRYSTNYEVLDQSPALVLPPGLDPKKVKQTPHLGHNIRDYCQYIVDNYSKLPDWILFCSGNVFPRHVSEAVFQRLIKHRWFTPIEDSSRYVQRLPHAFISSDGRYNELNNDWYLKLNQFHPTKYFHSYNHFLQFCFIDPVLPKYIRFAPGANYLVSKQQILYYPKQFYQNLITFVSHSTKAIPGESHIIERAFHTIWSGKFLASEAMSKPIDISFVPQPAPKVPIYETVILIFQKTADFWLDQIKKIYRRIYFRL